MPNRVAHFEIHAQDPERAVAFYSSVFGWEIKKWEGSPLEYWMVMTGKQDEAGGINGGLIRRKGPPPDSGQPVNAFVCTVVVDSYDAIAAKIEAAGGKNVVAKHDIAGMAWQGYFHDTEGNIIGIHEPTKKTN